MKNPRLLSIALFGALALTAQSAQAQSCTVASSSAGRCFAVSGGLIFFGRDDYSNNFKGANPTFAGTNSVAAYNDFVAAVNANSAYNNGLGVQTFDGFNTSTNAVTLGSSQAITFGATATARGIAGVSGITTPTGAVLDVGDNGKVVKASQDPFGNDSPTRYPVSGSNYLVDPDDWNLSFLGGGATAFGYFGIDIAEDGLSEPLAMTIKNGGSSGTTKATFTVDEATAYANGGDRTTSESYCDGFLYHGYCLGGQWRTRTVDQDFDSGNLFFFAFVATNGTTFDFVKFDGQPQSNKDDIYGFDNIYASGVTAGQPGGPQEVTPEPATMTLLATGLAGMAAARRKKGKKA